MENNTVEQSDLDAANSLLRDLNLAAQMTADPRKYHRAFAGHRLASQAPLLARIETLEARNRLMGDVIDYACGHFSTDSDGMEFIEAYRMDEWSKYPGFVAYRKAQAARNALGRKA